MFVKLLARIVNALSAQGFDELMEKTHHGRYLLDAAYSKEEFGLSTRTIMHEAAMSKYDAEGRTAEALAQLTKIISLSHHTTEGYTKRVHTRHAEEQQALRRTIQRLAASYGGKATYTIELAEFAAYQKADERLRNTGMRTLHYDYSREDSGRVTVMAEQVDGEDIVYMHEFIREHPQFAEALLRHNVQDTARMRVLLRDMPEEPFAVVKRYRQMFEQAGVPLEGGERVLQAWQAYYDHLGRDPLTDCRDENTAIDCRVPLPFEVFMARGEEQYRAVVERVKRPDLEFLLQAFTYPKSEVLQLWEQALAGKAAPSIDDAVVRTDFIYMNPERKVLERVTPYHNIVDQWLNADPRTPAQTQVVLDEAERLITTPDRDLEILMRASWLGHKLTHRDHIPPVAAAYMSRIVGTEVGSASAEQCRAINAYADALVTRAERSLRLSPAPGSGE